MSGGGTRGVTFRKCSELLRRPEASEVSSLLAGLAELQERPQAFEPRTLSPFLLKDPPLSCVRDQHPQL